MTTCIQRSKKSSRNIPTEKGVYELSWSKWPSRAMAIMNGRGDMRTYDRRMKSCRGNCKTSRKLPMKYDRKLLHF